MNELRTGLENEASGEEWQDLGIESSIDTPVRVVPRSVVLFRLMSNSVFSQFAGEGLAGIYVVKIGIGTIPVEFEPSQRIEIVGIFANHRFEIKVVTEAFHRNEKECDFKLRMQALAQIY
jgi:hypothetical protein